jgi:ATP-binding cassette, subfamily F, member 3
MHRCASRGRRATGIGKSTLLNLISGGLEPTRGHIQRNQTLRVATFSQHHVDGLDLHLSPLQYFSKTFADQKDDVLRSHLSRFGVAAELAMQPMYTLSGGQKSRVAFAKVRSHTPARRAQLCGRRAAIVTCSQRLPTRIAFA